EISEVKKQEQEIKRHENIKRRTGFRVIKRNDETENESECPPIPFRPAKSGALFKSETAACVAKSSFKAINHALSNQCADR
ncbi:hypothetical protein DD771_08180, partial [Helicobacter pylori]